MSLDTNILVQVTANLTNALDLVTASAPLNFKETVALANGSLADQANNVFSDKRQIAASANDDIDLAGSLTNAVGSSFSFTKIKGIFVKADSANTNNIHVGGAASNEFNTWVGATGDIVVVRPGGLFALVSPDATAYAVTAGTGDILRLTNSAGGTVVNYDIVIVGVA